MQYARMNPKDYRSWLNGICLNPKCSFRSLPLDGLLETQATTPASQFVAPPAPHVPYSSSGKTISSLHFLPEGTVLKR